MLVIISTLSIFSATVIQVEAATPSSYTFGNTAVGALTNNFATDRDASRFQLMQDGILQSITVYFKNTGFNAKAAIYTDKNGAPSTLIAQSNTQAITTSGWQTFAVPQSSLAAGYYWLCIVSSSPSSTGTMMTTSTNAHVWKTNTYSGDYPSTFGTPSGNENTVTSIYGTYTVPTVTPSPTPVPTVTPSPTPVPTVTPSPTPVPTVTPSPTPVPTVTPSPTPVPTVTPSPTPVPTVTPSPTPVPTTTPTPKPTTTPTPAATPSLASSKLNAIWLEHPETEFLNQNQQTVVQKLLNSNTKIVFVQIGNWKQSSSTVSINYWWSSQTIKNTINAIKTYSNNQIEVHAWIIWSTGNTKVNLADSSIRAKTVTAAVNCVQSYGFDGFNDDLYEGFTGSDSNYVTYANALGNALTAIGKKSSVDLFAMYATNIPTLYGGITQVTYVCPMFYDSQPWYPQWIKDQINAVLSSSKCPVLAGLMAMQGRGVTLTQQLSAVGHPTSSKFAGVALWSLAYMQTTDWTAYTNWTK